MQSSSSKKLLAVSTVFMLGSFAVFLFLYMKVDKSNTEADNLSVDWQVEMAKRKNLDSLDSLVKKIDKERAMLDTHFAHSGDIVPFLDMIDSVGVSAGVKSSVATIDTLADKSAVLVEVKANGSFENIYKFLGLLENSSYELEFASMDMMKEGTEESEGKKVVPVWVASFKIKLLSFLP
jgi:hypothetical protein